MASGFVTNDGKDLDSRYLGINAKAASAKTADTATKATTATTATTATNVTNKGAVSRTGSLVHISIKANGSYSCPAAGVVAMNGATGYFEINGSPVVAGFCNAGDTLSTRGNALNLYLCKTRIS